MDRIFIVIYFAALLIPFALADFRGDKTKAEEFKKFEKRANTTIADIRSADINNVFDITTKWFNENFWGRKFLIKSNSALHLFLNVSPKPRTVLVGKQGWLYLGDKFNNLHSQLNGRNAFTKQELNHRLKYMTARQEYLSLNGIAVLDVAIPEKQSIYPEYLTLNNKLNENAISRLDEFKEVASGLNFMSIKEVLLNAKSEFGDLLYNKTDSHWSNLGAYLAYKSMMEELNSNYPQLNINILQLKDFKIKDREKSYGLAQMIYHDQMEEFVLNLKFKQKLAKIKTRKIMDQKLIDKYKVSRTRPMIISENSQKSLTLLFFGDSFQTKMYPFLNQSFGKVIYIPASANQSALLKVLTDQYNPDVVIFQMAERHFSTVLRPPLNTTEWYSENFAKKKNTNLIK